MTKYNNKTNEKTGNNVGNKTGRKKRANTGKKFEQNIQKSLQEATYCYRLRDSPSSWGKDSTAVRFTLNNLCDFIIFHNNKLYMTEAKSTKGKSLPFGNIRENQLKGFSDLRKYKESGVIGMFLIEFSDLGQTFAIESDKLLDFMETADRKSFPVLFLQNEGIELKIQKGKRVRLEIEEGFKILEKREEK